MPVSRQRQLEIEQPPYSNVVDGAEEYERLMEERIRELRRQEGEVEPEPRPGGP